MQASAASQQPALDDEQGDMAPAIAAPIAQQSKSMRAYRRARRSLRDVNPTTGQETSAPGSGG